MRSPSDKAETHSDSAVSSSSCDPFSLWKSFNATVVQWNHACFGVRGVSKHMGSNPIHGPSVG
ncbi:hypothetical protein E2C01_036849 [Portunus trituberculatus]|uniref:Uncharacterized protein n=1 Tax=Portunus trituberculatus TaxID=210409 RepID=A0A5B7FD65_PORTR|nr:hypothetical protein [Portunus trituberculatus]